MEVIYSNLCPVCGDDLNSEEIDEGFCKKTGSPLYKEDERYSSFLEFFKKAVGEARAIQRMWAKRILKGESFAAVAPTGIGKTSFGIAISLFLAREGKRCYIILPTTLLLEQVVASLERYAENSGISVVFNGEFSGEFNGSVRKGGAETVKVAYYHGRLKKNEKENFFKSLDKADILISTTQFLSKHFKEIKDLFFDFIFVDDVDAVLKASKNVERLLNLLGFRHDNGWKAERRGCLMVSTATAKKGRKAELFRKLLNFDVGSSIFTARNIEDTAIPDDLSVLPIILENMGGGGLIFTKSSDEAEKVFELLKERFRIGLGGKRSDFERFRNSELDFLVGPAHYYGSLVRGLDLPERIRYAVFIGCPAFRIRFEDIEDPSKVSDRMVKVLFMLLRQNEEIKRFVREFERFEKLNSERKAELRRILKHEVGRVNATDIVLRENELIIPDVRTYIQASGRTSRLYSGGITKGASFIIESDSDVLQAFKKRAEYSDIEISVKKTEEIDFESLKKEIDESRKKFGKRFEFDLLRPVLFIVESPTKAKQISRFFGRPSVRVMEGLVVYEIPTSEYILQITASLGHVTDLITNRGFHGVEILDSTFIPVFSSIKRCQECGYQFTSESERCPKCGSENISDSRQRIEGLRKLADEVGRVIIGTDPDSEGEKIAWDLKNLLSGYGEIKRAEFHEITKKAVNASLSNLREIDENLVKAQIVRRVEDRWIGFVLSLKLQEVFGDRNLSAGRAQSPVLGWILERTKESRQKKIVAVIDDLDLVIEDLEDFRSLRKIPKAEEIELGIELVEKLEIDKTPFPPYTTDTLLRDANRILKLSASQTMKIAQDLFENGLITYHRTDSTRVSELGMRIAKEYLQQDFVAREWHAEGAHECIRPTRPLDRESLRRLIYEGVIRAEGIAKPHLSLYDLIFRRFMASQCKDFRVRVAKYKIKYNDRVFEEERIISANGRAFKLFRSVLPRKELPTGRISAKARFMRIPKALPYSEAEIVQLMKLKGIGRPSTYATIIERLFTRGYIIERNRKVIGTRKGFVIHDYLSKNYSNLISEERTKSLEEKMDKVAKGELDYMQTLKELYEEIKSIE